MRKSLLLLLLPFSAFAQVESFHIGEELNHTLSLCVSKESAVAVIEADVRGGFPAAAKVYEERDDCTTLPVTNATAGAVVKSLKVKRGDVEKTASVVEIVRDGKVLAYLLTTSPILARLQVEPKRGTKS